MDEKMNVPPYIMKQIIANTLYDRKNELVQKAQLANQQARKTNTDINTVKNYIETAMSTQEMATQIRIGNIPLDQCIAELTPNEKKIVYHKCEEWFQQNHGKQLEEKDRE